MCVFVPWPQGALRVHALEWAGRTVSDKLEGLRKEMSEAGAGALLVTMLGAARCAALRWEGSAPICSLPCVALLLQTQLLV
jgi:hypothetical protein